MSELSRSDSLAEITEMEENPLVSFFLGTYNRKKNLRETLQKVFEQTYRPIEVVVVDNGSTDGAPEMVETEFPQVKLIRLTRNHGHIASRNIACANTRGKYVVCLDDDSFPGPNCVHRMVEEFEKDQQLGLMVFGIYIHDLYIDQLDRIEQSQKNVTVTEKYNWSGCGGAYRRDIVEKHGYWEEWGAEAPYETALAAKAIHMGYTGKQFSDIYVLHHWSALGEPAALRVSKLADTLACRGMLLFAFKYFPLDLKMLGYLLKFAWIGIFNLFDTGRWTMLNGIVSGWRRVPYIVRERLPLTWQQITKLSLSFNVKGR